MGGILVEKGWSMGCVVAEVGMCSESVESRVYGAVVCLVFM